MTKAWKDNNTLLREYRESSPYTHSFGIHFWDYDNEEWDEGIELTLSDIKDGKDLIDHIKYFIKPHFYDDPSRPLKIKFDKEDEKFIKSRKWELPDCVATGKPYLDDNYCPPSYYDEEEDV